MQFEKKNVVSSKRIEYTWYMDILISQTVSPDI